MKKIKKQSFNLIFLAALSLAAIFAVPAQSTDGSKPTALTSGEFSGKGPNKETNYYFNFTGGAGEVTIALELRAKQYSTFARLELLDAGLNPLAAHNMNAATSTGTAQALKKIALGEKQTVLLKLTLDANLAEYKITLGGAVEGGASTPTDGSSTKTNDAATSADADKFFNVDLGKFRLGQFINLPETGMLVIRTKDGATQEIDLRTIKSVTIKKP
jgi:hypothetical protein